MIRTMSEKSVKTIQSLLRLTRVKNWYSWRTALLELINISNERGVMLGKIDDMTHGFLGETVVDRVERLLTLNKKLHAANCSLVRDEVSTLVREKNIQVTGLEAEYTRLKDELYLAKQTNKILAGHLRRSLEEIQASKKWIGQVRQPDNTTGCCRQSKPPRYCAVCGGRRIIQQTEFIL